MNKKIKKNKLNKFIIFNNNINIKMKKFFFSKFQKQRDRKIVCPKCKQIAYLKGKIDSEIAGSINVNRIVEQNIFPRK